MYVMYMLIRFYECKKKSFLIYTVFKTRIRNLFSTTRTDSALMFLFLYNL